MDELRNLASAWSMWAQGHHLESYWILGHQVFWWGRVGKVLEFVAGSVVVADIIGPDRLDTASTEIGKAKGAIGKAISYAIVGAAAGIVFSLFGSFAGNSLLEKGIVIAASALLSTLVQILRTPASAFVGLVADGLRHPVFMPLIRVGGFTCLAFGFHFDLLAS
jgi:hypothetical protein